MRIIGIDPGLITTGYGVVELASGNARVLEAGVIQPKRADAFEIRIAKVYTHLTTVLTAHKPDVVVIEKLYAHYKHPTTACILGHVRGVICLSVAHQKISLVEHSVKRIRKSLLGNGNASKLQVQGFVKRLLNLNDDQMPLDVSDALALALGHAHMIKLKLM